MWWNCGCMTVAETRDDESRATQDLLLGDVSHHSHHMCCVVTVRTYWPDDWRDPCWHASVAILDKDHSRCNRFHRWTCVHVCSVQNVRPAVPSVACLQPRHLCPGLLESSTTSDKYQWEKSCQHWRLTCRCACKVTCHSAWVDWITVVITAIACALSQLCIRLVILYICQWLHYCVVGMVLICIYIDYKCM